MWHRQRQVEGREYWGSEIQAEGSLSVIKRGLGFWESERVCKWRLMKETKGFRNVLGTVVKEKGKIYVSFRKNTLS